VLPDFAAEDIEKLAKLISEYSMLVVGCAILLVAFMIVLGYLIKQNQKNMQVITDLNKQLVDKLLEESESSEHEEHESQGTKKSETNLVIRHVQLNEELQKQLKILRDETDCDRTYIFMFHNGEYTLNRFPFLKATCFFEWKLYTIKQTMSDQRAIPVSILTTLCNNLLSTNKYSCDDINLLQDNDPMLYGWLKNKGTKSFFGRSLKDEDGNLIGFIACDYLDTEFSQVSSVKKIEERLRLCSLIVSPLIRVQ
jgi:hypothetical protein